MAGINRLGKGKPTHPRPVRPQDPNRNRVVDMFSEGTENDADYQRMVQDIEDAQQSQVGWLFGRGAFDKADLLYLRDEEEKRRFKETELRDSERSQFHRLRAQAGTQAIALGLGPGPPARGPHANGKPVPLQARVQATVKVKPVRAAGLASSEPVKRQKVEGPGGAPNDDRPAAAVGDASREEPEGSPAGNGEALAGLLGGYGTASDDEDSAGEGVHQQPNAPKQAIKGAAADGTGCRPGPMTGQSGRHALAVSAKDPG